MNKKIIVLGLLALLGMSLPVSARGRDMGPCGGYPRMNMHASHRMVPPMYAPINRYPMPTIGLSFATRAYPRRCYYDSFYYNYPIDYPMYNSYYAYPHVYTPGFYMGVRL